MQVHRAVTRRALPDRKAAQPRHSTAHVGVDELLQFLRRRPAELSPPDTEAPIGENGRFSIGLALGGGAARGFAHIGVIRALSQRGIRPDVITGTSIGAVAGALYAAGQLDTFETWARGLNRRRTFGYLDFSLSGSGIITGNRIERQLRQELGQLSFSDLPIRFSAVATEIGTGHEVWLTRGGLVEALRASYALPGIFPPVRIGRRWLMDGALVNPVPVSAARALGARLVIAVNLNADVYGRGATIHEHGPDDDAEAPAQTADGDRLARLRSGLEQTLSGRFRSEPGRPGIPTVMVDAFNVILDRITRSRLAGDPPDVLINPRLGRIGLLEFHRAEEAIALGAEAADKAIDTVTDAIAALS